MTNNRTVLSVCAVAIALIVAATGILLAAPGRPKSVIHVITVKWKDGATPDQINAALHGAETMNYAGLKNVWTKTLKIQGGAGYKNVIVMEFASEDAFKNYAGSDAQKKWYEAYMAVREESRTHDITN
jgi:hypothetical protein